MQTFLGREAVQNSQIKQSEQEILGNNEVVECVLITPEIAKELLKTNHNNRACREYVVEKYKNAILNDEWQFNGETIKLSKSGVLLDGQHRLHAIVEANKPVKMLLARNLDDNVFNTIDVGFSRHPGDILTVHTQGQCKNPKNIASALKLINSFVYSEHPQKRYEYVLNKKRELDISPSRLVSLYDVYTDITDNYYFILKLKDAWQFTTLSVAIGMYTIMKRIDLCEADRFWLSLNSMSNLSNDNPINVLHKYLVSYAINHGGKKPPRYNIVALICETWNAFLDNKTLSKRNLAQRKKLSYLKFPKNLLNK